MQLKVFMALMKHVSAAEAEMILFSRGHRILAVKKEFVADVGSVFSTAQRQEHDGMQRAILVNWPVPAEESHELPISLNLNSRYENQPFHSFSPVRPYAAHPSSHPCVYDCGCSRAAAGPILGN